MFFLIFANQNLSAHALCIIYIFHEKGPLNGWLALGSGLYKIDWILRPSEIEKSCPVNTKLVKLHYSFWMLIQDSIHFEMKLNEPGVQMNVFLLKKAGKTFSKILQK